jgi:hypothetical protein
MSVVRRAISILLLPLALGAVATVAEAKPPAATTTSASPDRSTPAAGYKTLLDALDRGDIDTIADSILYSVDLTGNDRILAAQRSLISYRLFQSIEAKFGNQIASQTSHLAGLGITPQPIDVEALQFKIDLNVPKAPRTDLIAQAIAQPTESQFINMTRVGDAWKYDRSHGPVALLAFTLEDAPWRNQMLQRALADLNAGKIKDENALMRALIPQPPTTQPSTQVADRSVPRGVSAAVQAAIDADDINTVLDCFTTTDGSNGAFYSIDARLWVSGHKLAKALRSKFGPIQGDRLVQECFLDTRNATIQYSNVQWVIDGDVARGVWAGRRFDPFLRMLRRNGVWRIELPPDRFGAATPKSEVDRRQKDLADGNTKEAKIQEVLTNLNRYPDPGSILDELNPASSDEAHRDPKKDQTDAQAQHDEQLAELGKAKREFATTQASLTPQDRAKQEFAFSFMDQVLHNPHGDAIPDSIYTADGPDGPAYIRARLHRRDAAGELSQAATREVDSGAGKLLYDFTLIDAADDYIACLEIEWTFTGDRATGKMPDVSQPFWIPKLHKIGKDWKIDLTDETNGNPSAAAARAETETKSIEKITTDVKALKFQTLDQVVTAMKAADIHGTGKPM